MNRMNEREHLFAVPGICCRFSSNKTIKALFVANVDDNVVVVVATASAAIIVAVVVNTYYYYHNYFERPSVSFSYCSYPFLLLPWPA